MRFRPLSLDDLHIEDERSYRHVALYDTLKQALRRDGYRFRVPVSGGAGGSPRPTVASWDRVLFLNLTFWDPGEQGDVLAGEAIPADVVTHVAWHHLARRALERASAGRSAEALFLAEAIASAFDLYLVGRLLGHAPGADLLETQVPAMSEVTEAAGLSQADFEALLEGVAADPDRAFEDLRALLFDAAVALSACTGVDAAAEALDALDKRRFGSLLHHYELSNWILYARAHGTSAPDPAVRAVDATLRAAPIALEWLEQAWVSSDTGTIGSSG